MTCPSPDYCGVNGCTNAACHPSRQAAVPARPERYERARGWGRQLLAASLVVTAAAAMVVAALVLLP